MRITALLLLAAWTALACADNGYRRTKREELLIRSKRRWVLSTIEITEEDKGPFPKEISQMYNDKQGTVDSHLFKISGAGVTEEPLGLFSIDENNGKVYAHKAVDREEHPLFHIKFDILDKKTGKPIDKELSFDVEIKDINDNAPFFLRDSITTAKVPENTPEGYLEARLICMDRDQEKTINSTMTITMVSQNPKEPKFELEQMNERTAQLRYSGCLDADKVPRYDIIAKVADHGKEPLSSTAKITVFITDSNTHRPTFKKTEYYASVDENVLKKGIVRLEVEDKDKPRTPGWQAKYSIISGNEDKTYAIETDPKTNEGILSVVKKKDFIKTTNVSIQIEVDNVEPLFHCKHKSGPAPKKNVATVIINTVDLNDPPAFDKDKVDVYQKEEEPPGIALFTPKVTDVDSDLSEIRFVLLEDPADWMKIDPITGTVSTTKKMDRESPFVDDNNVYKVVVGAYDQGMPPATGTSTILIHLKDINDHKPTLLNNSVIYCADMDKVPVKVQDLDAHPYSGPFAFSLDGKDKKAKDYWKLEPPFGEESTLKMKKSLAFGNYSVPLVIQDQQNEINRETLSVVVCECGKARTCITQPLSVNMGGPAIGLIIGSLLLFLLLLLALTCLCGKKFQPIPEQAIDEGHQTLIMYNQEGGSSECKAEPAAFLTTTTTTTNNIIATDGQKIAQPMMTTLTKEEIETYNRSNYEEGFGNYDWRTESRRADRMYSNGAWGSGMGMGTNMGSSRYRSYNLQVNQHITDHLHRKLQVLSGGQAEEVDYQPHEYAYEGEGSISHDLDQLSMANWDLEFLNNLGPKFKTLGGICQEAVE